MYCPNCRTEYQADATICTDCGAELVEDPPLPEGSEEPDYEWEDLETVLVTSDATLLPVVKSVLESEGIDAFAQGEMLQDFMGIGRLAGPNLVTGSIEIQVHRNDAKRARALLQATDSTAVDLPESS